MPNRTEAAQRKPRQLATGRLQPLRLFSTPPTIRRVGSAVGFSAGGLPVHERFEYNPPKYFRVPDAVIRYSEAFWAF
jgi:hypothetical protein